MLARVHRPGVNYGFARQSPTDALVGSESSQVTYAKDLKTDPLLHRSDHKQQPEVDPVIPTEMSRDDHWIVRQKPSRSGGERAEVAGTTAKDRPDPAFVASVSYESFPSPEVSETSKRWLALSLACLVYIIGLAGIWSIVSTFDSTNPPTIAPAKDSETMPPISDKIDLRDARLNGAFIPKFRPDIPLRTSDEIATSAFQKKI